MLKIVSYLPDGPVESLLFVNLFWIALWTLPLVCCGDFLHLGSAQIPLDGHPGEGVGTFVTKDNLTALQEKKVWSNYFCFLCTVTMWTLFFKSDSNTDYILTTFSVEQGLRSKLLPFRRVFYPKFWVFQISSVIFKHLSFSSNRPCKYHLPWNSLDWADVF